MKYLISIKKGNVIRRCADCPNFMVKFYVQYVPGILGDEYWCKNGYGPALDAPIAHSVSKKFCKEHIFEGFPHRCPMGFKTGEINEISKED